MGTLHGGILCDIADAAMGIAYASNLDEGESFTTSASNKPHKNPTRFFGTVNSCK
jgi:acyl-coenzyme A thioesterase PaaI-like protein